MNKKQSFTGDFFFQTHLKNATDESSRELHRQSANNNEWIIISKVSQKNATARKTYSL